eukprot:m.218307 g.218307  ORF g.218307 m.218307 type:complete len:822 (-) comp33264_c0_seq1:102-2567(-)
MATENDVNLQENLLDNSGNASVNEDVYAGDEEDVVYLKEANPTVTLTVPREEDYTREQLEDLRHAGIFLREGEVFHAFSNHPHTHTAIQQVLFLNSRAYCIVELAVAMLYLLLTIIEYPSVFPETPLWISAMIEVFCLLFFVINLMLRGRANGLDFTIRANPAYFIRIVIVLALIIDMVFSILKPTHPRYVRVLRVVLVLDPELASPVRRIVRQIIQTFYGVADMLILLVLYILLWSVLAFYFFGENPDDPYFSTLGGSYVSMFILITTANYPDVMMPAYWNHWASCIFFILYMMFGFYFLANIVLAMVFESFTDTEKRKFKKQFLHQREACDLAWARAGSTFPNSDMNFKQFYMVCKFYRDTLSNKHIYLAYRAIDVDLTGTISLVEFYQIFDVLSVKYSLNTLDTLGTLESSVRWHQRLGSGSKQCFRTLQHIVEHYLFEYFIDAIIVANTIFIIVEAAQKGDISGRGAPVYVLDDKGEGVDTLAVEWAFFAVYATEVTLKMLCAGPRLYFSVNWNKFDFFVTCLSFIGIVVQEVANPGNASFVIIVFIRSLRLLRLIRIRKSFRSVVSGMGYMIPKMGRFVGALLIIFYVFAIIGMGAFSFTVSKCSVYSGTACEVLTGTSQYNCSGAGAILENQYNCGGEYSAPYSLTAPLYPHNNGAGYYQLNNFDNILYSYVTLFEQMIVNNWFVAMNGHVYMVGEGARVFFMLFFLIAVLVCTNIVISFIVNSFMGVFPILKARQKGELGYLRAFNEKVTIRTAEAHKIFDSNDLDLFQPVKTLVYQASQQIQAHDIDRILFESEMNEWLQEEQDKIEIAKLNN